MIEERLEEILAELPADVKLVAVSKFHPLEDIMQAYQAGQRRFGENRPQELARKAVQLSQDIEWHFIGHLQTNKLKLVLPYASLVESVDSLPLLEAINAWGEKNGKVIDVLLEVHIAAEDTKGGFDPDELEAVVSSSRGNVRICGLMGMATHTDDENAIRDDFSRISALFNGIRSSHQELSAFRELSIGMSGDWRIALDYGATIVRIGTSIFGPRQYIQH